VTAVTGFNPLSSDGHDICGEEMKVLEEEIYPMKYEQINGADRMFPFGPTCTFNGVEVPTFVTCNKDGSITSQLLTNMLSNMDDYCLFDHSNGINPFLLCDGHGSRVKGPFIEYILESLNIDRQKSFTRVDTNPKAIAERGCSWIAQSCRQRRTGHSQ
jgi:hypothetical protein